MEAQTIPAQIKTAREAIGKSQEACAREFGTTLSTWGRWERGETEPTFEQLAMIARLLNTTLEVRP